MGNLTVALKRFVGNKNTITIIGVLAGIAVLYFGYNYRVNQAVKPMSVPYAKVAILGNSQITSEQVGSIKVSKSMVDTTANLVTSSQQVIGKFCRYDTTIAEGSLFYKTQLMNEAELPNAVLRDIENGFTVFSLKVDLHSTYGNSIMPKDYIDLYFKAVDDDKYIVFGRYIESIQVLAVKDAQGQHVFSSASKGTPSELLFAVPNDYFQLLMKTKYIKTNNIELVPVPRNAQYSENPGDTIITSEEITEFINSKALDATQNAGLDDYSTGGFGEEATE